MLTLLPLLKETQKTNFGCFELLGFDILLTDQLKPMLIEVNLGPSLAVSCHTDSVVKKPLLEDMLDIVLGEPAKKRRMMTIDEESYLGGSGDFELIFPFNSATSQASHEIAQGINAEENMDKIIEQIVTHFGDLPTKTGLAQQQNMDKTEGLTQNINWHKNLPNYESLPFGAEDFKLKIHFCTNRQLPFYHGGVVTKNSKPKM